MALTKKTETTSQSARPAFEDTGSDTAVAEHAAEAAATPAPTSTDDNVKDEAKASVVASTAVAAAATSSRSVANLDEAVQGAKKFQRELEDMRGSCDFSFGNYRTFKANNGEIAEMNNDKESLGRWAKVRLIGWDEHFEISPGTKDGKEYVAYSKDGKVVDHVIGEDLKQWAGKSCSEYLQFLTDEGFDESKMRRFIDTAVALLGCDTGDGPVGEVIQVTLSESSIPAFSKYQQQLKDKARCVAMGLPGFSLPDDPFTFFMIRESAEKGTNRWTKLKISATLPTKI